VPGRILKLEAVPDYTFETDQPIMRRIVGNMVLNALEATPEGGTVLMRALLTDDKLRIEVENSGEIPQEIQRSLFKRSFSTKSDSGRGIGTYSMKLFGERYLGAVSALTAGKDAPFLY